MTPGETLWAPLPGGHGGGLGDRRRGSPSPACTGTWDTLEGLVMWSSMSVTISPAVAICQGDPGVSCVRGLGLSPAWPQESTYLYSVHTSFPMDPCGQT